MVFPSSPNCHEGQRKTWHCSKLCDWHRLADCAYTYILSQQVGKHKLQLQRELYSTATITSWEEW